MQITLGGQTVVTATEQWRADIRAGRAFGKGDFAGPVAGQYAHMQLLNPGGSGKQVIIRSVILSHDGTSKVQIARYDTACATDISAGANMLIGGAAGVAHLRLETSAGLLGTVLFQLNALTSDPVFPVPDWFCELSPGQGIVARMNIVNLTLEANFFWVEG